MPGKPGAAGPTMYNAHPIYVIVICISSCKTIGDGPGQSPLIDKHFLQYLIIINHRFKLSLTNLKMLLTAEKISANMTRLLGNNSSKQV